MTTESDNTLTAIQIINNIKSDNLIHKQKVIIDVLDADEYIIAEIDVTDRYITFNYGFYVKGREIPCLRTLLNEGYDCNFNQHTFKNDPVRNIKTIEKVYVPTNVRTADEVIRSYAFKNKVGDWVEYGHPDHAQMMYDFCEDNIFAKEVNNFLGDVMHVGDISNPAKHPQWIMIKSEWVKLKTKPDDVDVVDDIDWTKIVSTCEHFQSTCKAESIRMDIADTINLYISQSDAEPLTADYKKKYLKIIPGGGRCIVGCNELVYEVYDQNTDKCWLMTRAEWDKL